MTRKYLPLMLAWLAALACNGLGLAPSPNEAAQQTQIAERVNATLAAEQNPVQPPRVLDTPTVPATEPATTAQPIDLPTAQAPTVPPTQPPTARPLPTAFTPISTQGPNPQAVYSLQTELPFGDYVVRYWHDTSAQSSAFGDVVVIAASGEAPIQIDNVTKLDQETGMDINGDGLPELILETYSGGAHCCFANIIYTMLGSSIREILHSVESNCGGRLIDLNGDGILEYDTCDDSFAYAYCPFAASPAVRVIYAYDASQGVYTPATPKFANLFTDQITQDTQRAEQAQPGEDGEFDNTTKCQVLPVVLDYLYSGQTNKAWSEFNRLYTLPDAATWQADIQKTVSNSVRYVAP